MSDDGIEAITMPKWGLAMSEGMVGAWHVEEGATIAAGDEALDIETEKITNVYESPVGGVLRRRVVDEGETVPVGALLGVVAPAEVPDADIDAFVERFQAEFADVLAARASADDTGPEPQTIEAGGKRLRYLEMAPDEAEGTPVVLIHGFGGDLNGWLFNQPALAEKRRVVALDLPGHGGSDKDLEQPDVEGLGRAVDAFLGAADLPRVHLVGHSLGGAIAAWLAVSARDRVASVTLVSPGGFGPDIDMEYIEGFIGAKRRKQMKAVVERLFADPSLVQRDMIEELLKFKRLDGVESALTAIAGTVFAGGRQARQIRDEFLGAGVPSLVIWGREDRIIPAAHAEGLESAQVHVLDDVGHMAHMEQAAEVNALIEKHVQAAD